MPIPMSIDDTERELARFRSQWQQELQVPRPQQPQVPHWGPTTTTSQPQQSQATPGPSKRRTLVLSPSARSAAHTRTKPPHKGPDVNDEEATYARMASGQHKELPATTRVAQSALDHFEEAIQREDEGSLGDSLNLYQKTYRMDPKVDAKYYEKHYPRLPSASAAVAQPHTQLPSSLSSGPTAVPARGQPLPINSLISSFSCLRIQANPLPILASPKPTHSPDNVEPEEPERGFSLLASLPQELLLQVLRYLAYTDLSSFARCALVCKSLAYIVSTEDFIWRDACHHPRWGFPGQVWNWKCGVLGEPLPPSPGTSTTGENDDYDYDNNPLDVDIPQPPRPPAPLPPMDLLETYNSYRFMFRARPRIRYNGVYISTCNYIRPGAFHASSSSSIAATPVHIVTYYRYLRFYPDGTCLSLLSTYRPQDIVYSLDKPSSPNTATTPAKVQPPNHPWSPHILRGRWRLCPCDSGEIDIDTESTSGEKYLVRMQLAIAPRAATTTTRRPGPPAMKLNKVSWRAFWCWNRLTDDLAQFSLRNDKPFLWSRVTKLDREILRDVDVEVPVYE